MTVLAQMPVRHCPDCWLRVRRRSTGEHVVDLLCEGTWREIVTPLVPGDDEDDDVQQAMDCMRELAAWFYAPYEPDDE
jgi:hypothetical protein